VKVVSYIRDTAEAAVGGAMSAVDAGLIRYLALPEGRSSRCRRHWWYCGFCRFQLFL